MNATVATQVETERTTRLGLNNSVFGVASRAVSGFSRAGILLFIASKYGPALFGKLALAMSVMEIFRVFSEFGIDTIAIRRFAQESERERSRAAQPDRHLEAGRSRYLLPGRSAGDRAYRQGPLTLLLGVVASLSLFSANLVGAFTSYYQSQLRMSEAFPPTLLAYGLYIAASVVAVFQHLPIVLVVCHPAGL